MASKQELESARELIELDVREVSLVDHGAIRRPFLLTKRGTPPCEEPDNDKGASLKVAELATPWNPLEAEARVRKWAGADEGPNAKYASAFLWKASNPEAHEDHKLQFADIVEGELTVIPEAVAKIATILQATRGDAIVGEQLELRSVVEQLYAELRKAFDSPELHAPWEKDNMADKNETPEATDTEEVEETPDASAPESEAKGDEPEGEETPEETEEDGEEEPETSTEDSKKADAELSAATEELMGAIGVALPALESVAEKGEDEVSRKAFGTIASFLSSVAERGGAPQNSEKSEGVELEKARRMTEARRERLTTVRDELDNLLKEFSPQGEPQGDEEEVETTKAKEATPASSPLDVEALAKAVAESVSKSVKTEIDERLSTIEKRLDARDHTIPAPNGQGTEGVHKSEGEPVEKKTSELFKGVF